MLGNWVLVGRMLLAIFVVIWSRICLNGGLFDMELRVISFMVVLYWGNRCDTKIKKLFLANSFEFELQFLVLILIVFVRIWD